jgi:hypothetical protein
MSRRLRRVVAAFVLLAVPVAAGARRLDRDHSRLPACATAASPGRGIYAGVLGGIERMVKW